MSTRAMVGYSKPDGTWLAVWNHWSGETQHLGRWIIREMKRQSGDFAAFCSRYVDGCPEGWSSLAEGRRCEEPVGFLFGEFDGIVARCHESRNPLCNDCHYLYLLHAPKRRLYVFEVKDEVMRPFGMITFDEQGTSTPRALPKVEEE